MALAGLAAVIWWQAKVTSATAAVAGSSLVVSGLTVVFASGRAGAFVLVEAAAALALIYLAVMRAPPRQAAIAGAMVCAAVTVMIVVEVPAEDSLREAAEGVAFWALAVIAVVGAGHRQQMLALRRSDAVTEARRSERLELARDLHDFVAHDVTGIVVRAQAARWAAGREPEVALAALERIEADGLRALAAMDRTVQALSEAGDGATGPADGAGTRTFGLEDLPELTDRFAATGSVDIHLAVRAEALHGLAPEVSAAGYRVAIEALTNVRRHAPGATRVDVVVAHPRDSGQSALTVTVTNDGALAGGGSEGALDANGRGGGHGLVGLRQRMEALGGTLAAGPEGDRWRVRAELPLCTGGDGSR